MENEENKLLELLNKESKEILKEQINSYRNAKASILAIANFIFLLLSFFLIELSTNVLVLFFTMDTIAIRHLYIYNPQIFYYFYNNIS